MVRQLKEVVKRDLDMPAPRPDVWPPDLKKTCASLAAQAQLEEAMACVPDDARNTLADIEETCAPPDAVHAPTEDPWLVPGSTPVTVRFHLPTDMENFIQQGIGLCRAHLGPSASLAACVETLVNTFLAEYLKEAEAAAKEHAIPERDGWQCLVLGCTNRMRLQVHHLEFVSQGGSDDDVNRSTLCVAHHLQGIHAGRMMAKGEAPDDVVWGMGIRPDGSPGQIYLGDRLLYSPT